MDLGDFDRWCRSLLEIDALASIDDSLNGIQVERSPGSLSRVAFAVDACAETIRRAAEAGCEVLFVHHGLFWGKPERVEGSLRSRLKLLFDADLALYACHLPLDKHPEVGNNAILARLLGLEKLEPFGLYHGVKLGFRGVFPEPIRLDEALRRVLPDGSRPRTLVPSGPDPVRTAAVVSGGAPFELLEAIREGVDLFVTGEPSHSIYHSALESRTSFLAAGHYATEVHGVRAVAERLALETGLETRFIDSPTGL
ncbi:MAG TPA: Nif3-like dinuclear metal center hexameric protein [Spirochaetia bacterium]|nr:Nif3-like dinuclear metal center hexameric protein [Spirochaetia bacterium]